MNEDLLTVEPYYKRATRGKRFLNYLIDMAIFTALFTLIGIYLTTVTSGVDEFIENDRYGFYTMIIYALYMSLLEAILKGKSFGKLITKTRAINSDGTDLSVAKAFARGFIRIVPFSALSALGTPCKPWHDGWTNTMVIDEGNYELG